MGHSKHSPPTDYLVSFSLSLSVCLPFVSINYNAHSWFFYACKVCLVHSMASIAGDKATRQIEKIETVLDSFFVVRKIEILVAGKWNIILNIFSKITDIWKNNTNKCLDNNVIENIHSPAFQRGLRFSLESLQNSLCVEKYRS